MVEPVVDYSRVEGISSTKTLSAVNSFVINTTQFLNRFSYVCELKLNDISRHIQQLEVSLALLEAKLQSVPGLNDAVGGAPLPAPAAISSGAPPAGSDHANAIGEVPAPAIASEAHVPAEPEKPVLKMKDDPRYARYFRMLVVGVPMAQVKQKMMAEGYPPEILENPDAPSDAQGSVLGAAPPAAAAPKADEGDGGDDEF